VVYVQGHIPVGLESILMSGVQNSLSTLAKKTFFVCLLLCAAFSFSTPALGQAGQLDSTFGKDGLFVALNAGLGNTGGVNNTVGTAIAIQSDGKIAVAGQAETSTDGPQPAVFRLMPNGALDTSFGANGVTTIDEGHGGGEIATCITIQSDSKIVVGIAFGQADDAPELAVARFNANGTIDTTFGNAGTVQVFRGGPDTSFLLQQPDGKLLVGGGLLMARLNANASLDTTFGEQGIALLIAPASSVALQSNGQILAVSGPSFVPLGSTPVNIGSIPPEGTIVRYNANGSVDATFGAGGKTGTAIGATTALQQSNGQIVAVGPILSKSFIDTTGILPIVAFDTDFGAARYNVNGSVDFKFGSHGGPVTAFSGASFAAANSLAIESNGDIIAAGQVQFASSTSDSPSASFALARYTSTGALDTTFGSGGTVLTPVTLSNANTAGIAAVALDSEGRLVAVGNAAQARPVSTMVVARYLTQ
jgi:uncharacterized delta-60 repeat protein